MKKELRFSGSGGQGVITAAIIYAEAGVNEGKEAVQSQSYGPEARGGASKAEVILSDHKIYHPHITSPDVVLAMTQKAADKYYGDLKENGLLVIDEDLVPNVPDFPNVVKIPITKIAAEEVGGTLYANMVALGAVTRLTDFLSFESVKNAVENRVPKHSIEANTKALNLGFEAAKVW